MTKPVWHRLIGDPYVRVMTPPKRLERIGDYLALGLLVAGGAMFALGRRALTDIANGAHPDPVGQTWVSLAERYDAQTRIGLWMSAIGLGVGILSSLRFFARRIRGRSSADTRPSS